MYYPGGARDYFSTLKDKVDVWEIADEVNRDWLAKTDDVVAKMNSAYSIVKAGGGKTALALHFGPEYDRKSDHEPFRWAQANVPDEMKKGLDYVLVSYCAATSGGTSS